MSSLYYQHRQHEQEQRDQQQLEQQQQQQQHYQYHLQQQQQQEQEQNYLQSHSHTHNYSNSHLNNQAAEHPTPPNNALSNGKQQQDCGSVSNLLSSNQNQPGHQSRDQVLDTLLAMMSQERTGYQLDSYFPNEVLPPQNGLPRQQNIIHGGWREKICQWSYNVVDHFDLPREIVSISLNYFDRYMATLSTGTSTSTTLTENTPALGNKNSSQSPGTGDLALLASLGTLHLATKVHATNHNDYDPAMGPLEEQHHKVPSLSTLANLSRGQFGPASILEMEKLLLNALQWRLHPPTLYAFVTFLLKLLPTTVEDPRYGLKPSIASELFEVAMYVAELSVCDAFFVERQIPSSIIALAAICTSMDELLVPEDSSMMAGLSLNSPNHGVGSSFWAGSGCFTEHHRALFLSICEEQLGLGKRNLKFEESLDRLRSMYLGASASNLGNPKNNGDTTSQQQEQQQAAPASQSQQSRSRTNSYNPPTSPSSIADMSLSTINSTIHSMADTTINGDPIKRGDSMMSSIACHSKTEILMLADHDHDNDEVFEVTGDGVDIGIALSDTDQHSHSNSNASNNFRYSPSPPREGEAGYNNESYDNHQEQQRNLRRSHHSSSIMSCSPIVKLH
jgi:hypothetical protein